LKAEVEAHARARASAESDARKAAKILREGASDLLAARAEIHALRRTLRRNASVVSFESEDESEYDEPSEPSTTNGLDSMERVSIDSAVHRSVPTEGDVRESSDRSPDGPPETAAPGLPGSPGSPDSSDSLWEKSKAVTAKLNALLREVETRYTAE